MKALVIIRHLLVCAAVLPAVDAQAQLEGPLFTQPEEREYLDYLREEFLRNRADQGFDIEVTDIPEIPDAVVVEETGPIEYSFGGVMTRRNGEHSIWLNGALLAENQLPEGFSLVESGRNVLLRILYDNASFTLRAGQRIDLTTGIVVENFRRQPQPVTDTTPPPPIAASGVSVLPLSDVQPDSAQVVEQEPSEDSDTLNSEPQGSDAVTAAINELDDSEVDALFEVLQSRRLERSTTDEEADEESSQNQ